MHTVVTIILDEHFTFTFFQKLQFPPFWTKMPSIRMFPPFPFPFPFLKHPDCISVLGKAALETPKVSSCATPSVQTVRHTKKRQTN